MPGKPTAQDVIGLLRLTPLPGEGGYFRQTVIVPDPDPQLAHTPLHTAILYLVTPESWSGLHMLHSDELFHFYVGDECRMVVCSRDGVLEERRLGHNLADGCQVQTLVPAGTWQGVRLVDGGEHGYALLGTTMTPGYRQDQLQLARHEDLDSLPIHVAAQLKPFLAPGAE